MEEGAEKCASLFGLVFSRMLSTELGYQTSLLVSMSHGKLTNSPLVDSLIEAYRSACLTLRGIT